MRECLSWHDLCTSLQLSEGASSWGAGETDYVVDALALHDHLHILRGVFADPGITKVLHGGDNDILWLQRDFHLYIVNAFDTEKACQVILPASAPSLWLCNVYDDWLIFGGLSSEDLPCRPEDVVMLPPCLGLSRECAPASLASHAAAFAKRRCSMASQPLATCRDQVHGVAHPVLNRHAVGPGEGGALPGQPAGRALRRAQAEAAPARRLAPEVHNHTPPLLFPSSAPAQPLQSASYWKWLS